ncbi:WD40 repeat domain-containing protein [Kribbella sp. NPDC049174]|uniref:WD40 repeat domain-containing protein n=1 Tax=Kribbella sp. NPDC049174 TaxID=3364112 RepID=UPI0037185317
MLRTWDLTGQNTLLRRTGTAGAGRAFAHADLSPDGRRVAYRWLVGEEGWIRFVDTATGASTRPQRLPVYEGEESPGAWSADGRRYASFAGCQAVCKGGAVSELDTTTGRIIREQGIIADEIYSLAYINRDTSLVAGDSAGTLTLIDAETLRRSGGPYDLPAGCCLAVSQDGRSALLFQQTANGASEHWRVADVTTGQVRTEGDVDFRARDADFSPDGRTVAITGQSGELVTIELATRTPKSSSTGLGTEGLHVRYSDDGSRLVTGALDGGVSLWDAKTLQLLGTVHAIVAGEPVVAAVNFFEGTNDVMIASYDGQIFKWDTNQNRAVELACQMAGRNLTTEEWSKFLPTQPFRKVCPQFP